MRTETFTFPFFLVIGLIVAGCSSTPAKQDPASEHINRIVASVREATSVGFADVAIDYIKPNIYVSGHAYSSAHISLLMSSLDAYNFKLLNIHDQLIFGMHTSAFTFKESNVGDVQNWSGPVFLKYPHTPSPAEISGDILHLYSLCDFVFVGAVTSGNMRKAAMRFRDGRVYSLGLGHSFGKEFAVIKEINDFSVILLEESGIRHEMKIYSETSVK